MKTMDSFTANPFVDDEENYEKENHSVPPPLNPFVDFDQEKEKCVYARLAALHQKSKQNLEDVLQQIDIHIANDLETFRVGRLGLEEVKRGLLEKIIGDTPPKQEENKASMESIVSNSLQDFLIQSNEEARATEEEESTRRVADPASESTLDESFQDFPEVVDKALAVLKTRLQHYWVRVEKALKQLEQSLSMVEGTTRTTSGRALIELVVAISRYLQTAFHSSQSAFKRLESNAGEWRGVRKIQHRIDELWRRNVVPMEYELLNQESVNVEKVQSRVSQATALLNECLLYQGSEEVSAWCKKAASVGQLTDIVSLQNQRDHVMHLCRKEGEILIQLRKKVKLAEENVSISSCWDQRKQAPRDDSLLRWNQYLAQRMSQIDEWTAQLDEENDTDSTGKPSEGKAASEKQVCTAHETLTSCEHSVLLQGEKLLSEKIQSVQDSCSRLVALLGEALQSYLLIIFFSHYLVCHDGSLDSPLVKRACDFGCVDLSMLESEVMHIFDEEDQRMDDFGLSCRNLRQMAEAQANKGGSRWAVIATQMEKAIQEATSFHSSGLDKKPSEKMLSFWSRTPTLVELPQQTLVNGQKTVLQYSTEDEWEKNVSCETQAAQQQVDQLETKSMETLKRRGEEAEERIKWFQERPYATTINELCTLEKDIEELESECALLMNATEDKVNLPEAEEARDHAEIEALTATLLALENQYDTKLLKKAVDPIG